MKKPVVTPPPSPITAFIEALPTAKAPWIAFRTNLVANPTPLVDVFDATVQAYARYENLKPFTPGRNCCWLPGCDKTEQVAAALERRGRTPWEVEDAPELNFVYLDREIVPQAGETRKGVTKIDIVLAAVPPGRPALTGRPVIGEIKTATDKDALHGLLQALAGAAQLSGPTQHERFRLWCSRADFVLSTQLPHVYVLLVNRPGDAALADAKALRDQLLKTDVVRKRLERIEFLHLTCDGGGTITQIAQA